VFTPPRGARDGVRTLAAGSIGMVLGLHQHLSLKLGLHQHISLKLGLHHHISLKLGIR